MNQSKESHRSPAAAKPENAEPAADAGLRLGCYALLRELSEGFGRQVGDWLVNDPLGGTAPGGAGRQKRFLELAARRLDQYRRREWLTYLSDIRDPLIVHYNDKSPGSPIRLLFQLKEKETKHKATRPLLRCTPFRPEEVWEQLLPTVDGTPHLPEVYAAVLLAVHEVSGGFAQGVVSLGGASIVDRILSALLPHGDPADLPLPRPLERALGALFLPPEEDEEVLALGCLTPPFEKLLDPYPKLKQEYAKKARPAVLKIRAFLEHCRDGEPQDPDGAPITVGAFCDEFNSLRPLIDLLKDPPPQRLKTTNLAFRGVIENVKRLAALADCLLPAAAPEDSRAAGAGKPEAPHPAEEPKQGRRDAPPPLAAAGPRPPAAPNQAPAKPPPSADGGRTAALPSPPAEAAPSSAPAAEAEAEAAEETDLERTVMQTGVVPPRPERPPPAPEIPSLFSQLAQEFPESLSRLAEIERLALPLCKECRDEWPDAAEVLSNLLRELSIFSTKLDGMNLSGPPEERRSQVADKVAKLTAELLDHLCNLDELQLGVIGDNEDRLPDGAKGAGDSLPEERLEAIGRLRDEVYLFMKEKGGYGDHEVRVGDDESRWGRYRDELDKAFSAAPGHQRARVVRILRRGYIQVVGGRRQLLRKPKVEVSK